jgi:hypothetical protein
LASAFSVWLGTVEEEQVTTAGKAKAVKARAVKAKAVKAKAVKAKAVVERAKVAMMAKGRAPPAGSLLPRNPGTWTCTQEASTSPS